jgi:hypothetical protein
MIERIRAKLVMADRALETIVGLNKSNAIFRHARVYTVTLRRNVIEPKKGRDKSPILAT